MGSGATIVILLATIAVATGYSAPSMQTPRPAGCSRRGLLRSWSRNSAATAAATAAVAGTATPAWADELPGGTVISTGRASFTVPEGFERFSKPVKTHLEEGNARSTTVKGFTLGVAVDPVKLESLAKFGDPEFVADRVVKVEKGRDGVTAVRLVAARATTIDGVDYYELEYDSESTRGYNHVLSRLTIQQVRCRHAAVVKQPHPDEPTHDASQNPTPNSRAWPPRLLPSTTHAPHPPPPPRRSSTSSRSRSKIRTSGRCRERPGPCWGRSGSPSDSGVGQVGCAGALLGRGGVSPSPHSLRNPCSPRARATSLFAETRTRRRAAVLLLDAAQTTKAATHKINFARSALLVR